MKPFLAAILLTLTSTSAMAEWELIHSGKEFDSYFDASTIKKDGNKAKMWVLWNYKTPQKDMGQPYLSILDKSIYDCKNETNKTLVRVYYKDNMRHGEVVLNLQYADNESTDKTIVPYTLGEIEFKAACGIE